MPRRTSHQTLDVYQQHLAEYVAQWGGRYRPPHLLRKLLDVLRPHARLLDLGCGLGQDIRYAASHDITTVGLDAVWEFLSWARTRAPRSRLIQADMRRLPIADGSLDAVWAAASMIHLTKREALGTLRALRRAVKPGGYVAATFAHGTTSAVLAKGWLPGRYISRWTKTELSNAVERSGWRIESLTTVTNRERRGRWLSLLAQSSPSRISRRS